MKVTNINGTSDNTCSCGSWLKHWEKFNSIGQKNPIFCPACGSEEYVDINDEYEILNDGNKEYFMYCSECGQGFYVSESYD